jgi:CubicO group peptidase (beta-lactamase class C family)
MRRDLRCPIALFGATLILPAALAAQRPANENDPFAAARVYIDRAMREDSIPSVAVAVAKAGRIVFAEGFGFADLDRRIPATPRTMYSLASISKPITATALMRLVEQGRVVLDRPANEYLGNGRIHSRVWDAEAATVRRVLSHTAGLPLHYEFFYEREDHGPRSTDEGIARYAILIAPPGEVYQYSNLGYGVIDRILERVHGRTYAEIMRTEVFEPLGMARSTVSTGAGLDDSVAVRYGPDNRPVPFYDFDHRGGSAVYASALDLARFGMFHLGSLRDRRARILTDSTIRLMQRPITPGPTDQGYGLGWVYLADDHGYRRIAHNGGMPGVATALHLYPDQKVVVVVLTNRSNGSVGRIVQELAGAVLPQYAIRAQHQRDSLQAVQRRDSAQAAQRAATPVALQPPPAADTTSPYPSALLGEWSGMIYTPDDSVALHLLVQRDGDVHVRLGNELRTLLNDVTAPYGEGLTGRFAGTLPDAHARRHTHSVRLDVRLRGDRLAGMASAQTTGWPTYFALSSFAELKRAGTR